MSVQEPLGQEPAPIPLPALLAEAEAAFAAEFDRRLARSEFCALSLAHSRNVLRHLGDHPRRASDIVNACGVSKQAISQQLTHLAAHGYLTIEPDPADGRARLLRLTEPGRQAQRLVKTLFTEIERDWAARLGAERLATVRLVLTELLGAAAGASCVRPSTNPAAPAND